MRTKAHRSVITLSALALARLVSGCDYYVSHAHGATYFGYPSYYYASAVRPEPNIYVPPLTAVGGGPTAPRASGAPSSSPAP